MKDTVVLSLKLDNGLTTTSVDIDNSCLAKDFRIVQSFNKSAPLPASANDTLKMKYASKTLDVQVLDEEGKIVINDIVLEGSVLKLFKDFINQL